ncbi:MAG: hydrogenase maturation protease [Acidobacteria bacterium]|nr:hydrogenase maturation protease [Acidobacteriota bacterium]
MTAGSVDRPPILVLGLGNQLLGDDGAGLRLLELLEAGQGRAANVESLGGGTPAVEFIDGGTQGLALLGTIENRQGLLILDAVGSGSAGEVHSLDARDLAALRARRASTAHEGNALELLEAATLLGVAPARTVVVGITPAMLKTGIGLSPPVEAALPEALRQAGLALQSLISSLTA